MQIDSIDVVYPAQSTHARCEERMVGQDEKRFAVCASEYKLERTFGHIDLRDLFAFPRVDEDLAVGNIDVPVTVHGYAFASTLCEGLEIRQCAIRVNPG